MQVKDKKLLSKTNLIRFTMGLLLVSLFLYLNLSCINYVWNNSMDLVGIICLIFLNAEILGLILTFKYLIT